MRDGNAEDARALRFFPPCPPRSLRPLRFTSSTTEFTASIGDSREVPSDDNYGADIVPSIFRRDRLRFRGIEIRDGNTRGRETLRFFPPCSPRSLRPLRFTSSTMEFTAYIADLGKCPPTGTTGTTRELDVAGRERVGVGIGAVGKGEADAAGLIRLSADHRLDRWIARNIADDDG